ncbi:twin-arginine translocation pathway signal protein [Rhodobacteraceae bacterium RKSG542]|uniref:esterase-like activity of phytase family protein n=1 Tax=Pseudovibrio flavus TaxID=2529854 RepID=UPI0012BD46A8|nr:esterase-like activity of phytase family protein [Pseudovibrio flavus]MTI18298.1 twin-arginine translocation pathway signal protein [Pseudovibrio flavus]
MKRSRRSLLRGLAAGAACAVVALTAAVLPRPTYAKPVSVKQHEITHFRIGKPNLHQFGPLLYLGGLEFWSGNDDFGGISGAITLDGGTSVILATDGGYWITADLDQTDSGKPLTLKNAQIAPMLSKEGKPLHSTPQRDVEALTLRTTGNTKHIWASYEGKGGMLVYPFPLTLDDKPEEVDLPAALKGLGNNKGIEALAAAPADSPLAGAVLLFAERGAGFDSDRPAYIIGGEQPGAFTVKRMGNFDVTDATFTPDGDLLILERLFTLREGLHMRIRRVDPSLIKPGAVIEGEILLAADMGYQIDNMEAITAHKNEHGETIITLLSDDNRFIIQRNLLLRFRLDS